MSSSTLSTQRGDGRLWVMAFALSLLINAAFVTVVAFVALKNQQFRQANPSKTAAQAAPREQSVMIYPEMANAAVQPPAQQTSPSRQPPPAKPRFSRTSQDQAAAEPESSAFIGERNTRATSDHRPIQSAPPLPSQSGIQAKHEGDLETTQSDYQDGEMVPDSTSASPARPENQQKASQSPDPAFSEDSHSGEKTNAPGNDDSKSTPPPRTELLQGQNPVDVAVPRDPTKESDIKPTPPNKPRSGEKTTEAEDTPKPTPPDQSNDPAFSGYQRKTAIVGSISRTGRSALDVVDSPLGRYQAVISRLIEQEWQRNCVRHRDFITPGFLTVRFFVETSGKVRTVQFVGEMETGDVQKGFTLNSIRDAKIPAMPAAVKKEFEKEPLELIFNFYF